MTRIATKVGALVSTVLLAAGPLALVSTPAAAADDVEITSAGWSSGSADISSGEEKNAKFTIRNNTKDTLKVSVTATIKVSCDVTVVTPRNDAIVVGPNSTSGTIDDATIRGGAKCNKTPLSWSARYRYVGTTEKPTSSSSATPSPSPMDTMPTEGTTEASASSSPTVLSASTQPAESSKSGGLALPFLLAFLGLLILALAGGILYFAQKQRSDDQ